MVDMEGNIEEQDVDYIGQTIQNNGENISNSIDALTKELRMYNILKIIESNNMHINYKGLSRQAEEIIEDYLR